jgi:branched-chain amino acid transport system ATP-binding protein
LEINERQILLKSQRSTTFGGVKAVQDVDLELASGEILGVIGPNGSGKTTLVNLITGFVKPDSGEVIFKNKKITGLPPIGLQTLRNPDFRS